MNFNKTIKNIIKAEESKIIWKNKNCKLELISCNFTNDYHEIPSTLIEVELIHYTDTPKQKLIDFLSAIEWLRTQKEVKSINYDITGDLIPMIGNSSEDIIYWNSMKCNISFQIEED